MSSIIPSLTGGQSESNFLRLAQRLQNLDSGGSNGVGEITEQSPASPTAEQPTGDPDQAGPSRQGREIQTGRARDVSVEGDGFIALEQGDRQRFTRSVSLEVDEQGNVTDAISGANLQRQVENQNGDADTQTFQLSEEQRNIQAQATSRADVEGNLSSQLSVGETTEVRTQLRNQQGETQNAALTFTRTAQNEFEVSATDPETGERALRAALSFDDGGNLDSADVQSSPNSDSGFEGLSLSSQSGENIEIAAEDLDFSGLTLGEGETTAEVTNTNGNAAGRLERVSIDENGQLQGNFSNGRTRAFGEVATAQFDRPGALREAGNGLFAETPRSGDARFSTDTDIRSGELEAQGGEHTRNIVDNLLSGGETTFGTRSQVLGMALDLFG